MNKLLALLFLITSLSLSAAAIDLNGLESVGAAQSFTKDANSVTFICADGSRVRVFVLAADALRVRVAFRKDFPAVDHSWAIGCPGHIRQSHYFYFLSSRNCGTGFVGWTC